MTRWEIITRKLLVLGEWGYPMDYYFKYIDDPDFLSEEFFKRYYGHELDRSVIDELTAIDLLAQANSATPFEDMEVEEVP